MQTHAMTSKVLFVDDDPNLLSAIQRTLHKHFKIDTCLDAAVALRQLVDDGPYAVVVADMRMPEMDGLEFLKKARALAPDTVRLMLTGNADQKTAVDAVNDGHVFRFLTKPCPPPTLVPALEAGLGQYRVVLAERELLENTLSGAVEALTEIHSLTDPQTFERSRRLREYARAFVQTAPHTFTWELELAAMLSQIGRVTVPAAVLAKTRTGISLTGPEKDVLDRIPEVSARLLEKIPRLEQVARTVRYHQKHFDGTGFPADSLGGEDIPVGSRILKVLSDLIELECDGVSKAAAFQAMNDRAGRYDPNVLAAAMRCFDVALDEDASTPRHPLSIAVESLRAGHVLAEDILTHDGNLVVSAGTKLSPAMLEKLFNFRLLKAIDETILVRAA